MGVLKLLVMAIGSVSVAVGQPLYVDFYNNTCPQAMETVKRVVEEAVRNEIRMAASLLRLHFHDCFVNGCDGSVLLDSTPDFTSEKFAAPNINSARGFEVIDTIKSEVDRVCGAPVVSCADILALAARDSVVAVLGPYWDVPLGRRDSVFANITQANMDIPAPSLGVNGLVASFNKQGLDEKDMVALVGAHTLGFAQCMSFRSRAYNDSNINPAFRRQLQSICPRQGGDTNLQPLNPTPDLFDTKYYSNILVKKGVLHSDQALVNSPVTGFYVATYGVSIAAFAHDFAKSMVKMGNIKPLTGDQGQVRNNCRKVN